MCRPPPQLANVLIYHTSWAHLNKVMLIQAPLLKVWQLAEMAYALVVVLLIKQPQLASWRQILCRGRVHLHINQESHQG